MPPNQARILAMNMGMMGGNADSNEVQIRGSLGWGIGNANPPDSLERVYTSKGSNQADAIVSAGRRTSLGATRAPSTMIPDEDPGIARERTSSRKLSKSPRKPKSSSHHGDHEGGAARLLSPSHRPPHRRTTTTTAAGTGTPRRTRAEEDDLQDVLAEIMHDQTLTLARAARRHSKSSSRSSSAAAANRDGQEPPSLMTARRSSSSSLRAVSPVVESQEGTLVKGTRRHGVKPRRQRRKGDTAVHDATFMIPEDDDAVDIRREQRRQQKLPGFHPLEGLQQFVSRVRTRKESTSPQSSSWMHLFGEVIMWRDVPRSALLFGAGCFCILSASFVKDVRCGALTLTAYMALMYLGAVFVHRNFMRGGASQHAKKWELGESEALEILKLCLPAINVLLRKCGELFCGDPATTLKVASILWLLAQAGYFMTIWSFARLAFFLMFVIPKLYVCYSHQLHGQAELYADRFRTAWSAYAHKKVAAFVGFVFVWNFSSATSRLYGAFLLLVTIKLYSRHLAEQASVDPGTEYYTLPGGGPSERLKTPPKSLHSPKKVDTR